MVIHDPAHGTFPSPIRVGVSVEPYILALYFTHHIALEMWGADKATLIIVVIRELTAAVVWRPSANSYF